MPLGLYQMVWIISFMHVYVCLLASMLYVHVCLSRSRLCHSSCPSWVCACESLGPLACVVAFVPLMDSLDSTTCGIHFHGIGLFDAYPFSTSCDVDMLALLALCLFIWLSFLFCIFYMLAYIFMHEFMCHPYSNPMELWTLNPNLHLSF